MVHITPNSRGLSASGSISLLTISILITEPGKNSPNLRNKRLARPSVTAPRSLEAAPPPRQFFVVQCNVWQSLMLHTYSGWGQERQRVTRLTSFMFCFQLAFGGWKTGLAKSACYAKCVPIWSDWILQKMSRYSAKAAQNTLQWEALVEWRGAIVLPFGFAEPFTKQFSSPHKKISFSPGPCHPDFEFVDLMSVDSWSKMMDVNISGWEECWQFDWSNLIWRHREQRTGSSWFWSGTGQLTDNWVREERPKVSTKEKLTAYFLFLEMHLGVQI